MIIDTIIERAKTSRARIAIGAARGYETKVVECAEKAAELGYAEVVIVSPKPLKTDVETVVSPRPEAKIVELLRKGKVEGIVRGSLDVNPVMAALRKQLGIKKLLRLALLKTPAGNPFLFAPVGIDDGWTLSEKVRLGVLGAELMRSFGERENIAVLGGGREDDAGRSKVTDKSIAMAGKATASLQKKGYRADCAYILIEDAVRRCNFILAPDGICGNLIYRTLCLIGGGSGMGGPAVGCDFVYVDTSRAGARYENAICTASALAGARRNKT
ncbi:MAG: methanogenesis marker protein Mmp4/MtxX [Syntrophaceae bacterium]